MSTLQPHQQRVVSERDELLLKLNALNIFIDTNPIYVGLPNDEKLNLLYQQLLMSKYADVLNSRISRF